MSDYSFKIDNKILSREKREYRSFFRLSKENILIPASNKKYETTAV